MDLSEKTINDELIYDGSIIRLRKETVVLPNGKEAPREIIDHPGGVGVIAIDDSNNILMVRQFRKPYNEVILEIPAGKLNYGENHYECGVRELEEETGYKASKYTYLGEIYPTPGFCNEILHIYLAEGLIKGEQKLDEDEFLNVEKMPFEEAFELVLKNEIKDCKSVIGILKTKILLNL